MKDLKKVKSRVKANYKGFEEEHEEQPPKEVTGEVDSDFFEDLPEDIATPIKKRAMSKVKQAQQEMEQQLQSETESEESSEEESDVETNSNEVNELESMLDEAIELDYEYTYIDNPDLKAETEEDEESKDVPDWYFEVGDIAEVTATDGIGHITDINDFNKQPVHQRMPYSYASAWYEKVKDQSDNQEQSEQEQESPQEAQNDTQNNENKKDEYTCTEKERAFLDVFLALQQAGKDLGMVRSSEQIGQVEMSNMYLVPRADKVLGSDRVFLKELREDETSSVWELVRPLAEEMGSKLQELLKEQDTLTE